MGGVLSKIGGAIGLGAGGPPNIPGAILGSGVGGAAQEGGIGGVGDFFSGLFDPSQRVVSGVPQELQAALAAAGINIEQLLAGGGALPQFGGNFGTSLTGAERQAVSGLGGIAGSDIAGPDLGNFGDISSQLQNLDAGDLGQTNQIIEQLRNSGVDLGQSDSILRSLEGLQGPDFGTAEGIIRSLGAGGPDTSAATSAASRLENLQGPDTATAASLIQEARGLATGAGQQTLASTLLPGLQTAVGAESFDNTAAFQQALPTFQADLADQLADIKAESSALGLGAGSSDRNRRLAETGARETGRFRLGLLDQERQSFESAEGRRIAALGAGRDVADVIGRPAETLAGLVPAALETGSRGAEFRQRGLAGGLPTLLDASLGAADIGQRGLAASLPAAVQTGQAGADFDLNRLLGSLDPSIRAALGQGQLQQQGLASALPTALQAGTFGANFNAQNLQSLLNPQLQAALGQGQFNLDARGQQLNEFGQLHQFGGAERAFGEAATDRKLAEFGRTQTGGFDLLSRLLAATPEQTTAFGPSTVSQAADAATGIATAATGFAGSRAGPDFPTFGGSGDSSAFGNTGGGFEQFTGAPVFSRADPGRAARGSTGTGGLANLSPAQRLSAGIGGGGVSFNPNQNVTGGIRFA